MKKSFFGTDGIRGRAGEFPVTPETVLNIGHALALALVEQRPGQRPVVIVGRDTRESGVMLESALRAGLASGGADSLSVGVLPTAAVSWLVAREGANAGVMISASHNPFYDNGLKFFGASGHKMPDDLQARVESLSTQRLPFAPCGLFGREKVLGHAAEDFSMFCAGMGEGRILAGVSVVVDCANGAAYQSARKLFEALGARVITVGDTPDGININEGVGATCPSRIAAEVKAQGAHFGVSLDGDADRLIMAGASGTVYDGDQLLYVMAMERSRHQQVPGVVGTVMSNMGLERALIEKGIPFVRTRVGDRHIMQELVRRGWHLGGESSGHLLDLSRLPTGDGLLAAVLVCRAMAHTGKSLDELAGSLYMYPQTLLSVPRPAQEGWECLPEYARVVREAQDLVGDSGRILVRPSGTEPVVRVMAESVCSKTADEAAGHLASLFGRLAA